MLSIGQGFGLAGAAVIAAGIALLMRVAWNSEGHLEAKAAGVGPRVREYGPPDYSKTGTEISRRVELLRREMRLTLKGLALSLGGVALQGAAHLL